jgi:hypothetical protein
MLVANMVPHATLNTLSLRAFIPHRPLPLLVSLAAIAVVASTWTAVIRTLSDAQPVVVHTAQPGAIVWGDRVFGSPAPLARWLRARGSSYAAWAPRHPAGRAVVEHVRLPVVTTAAPATPAPTTTPASTVQSPAAPAPAHATTSTNKGFLRAFLLLSVVLALLCLLAALTPWALGRWFPRIARVFFPYRQAFVAAAVAVSVGVVLGATHG